LKLTEGLFVYCTHPTTLNKSPCEVQRLISFLALHASNNAEQKFVMDCRGCSHFCTAQTHHLGRICCPFPPSFASLTSQPSKLSPAKMKPASARVQAKQYLNCVARPAPKSATHLCMYRNAQRRGQCSLMQGITDQQYT